MSIEDRLYQLREEFVDLLAEERKVREPILEKYRKLAEAEAEGAVENLRREFAIKFEIVRQMKGVQRGDLEKIVFKSKGTPRYRKFVELAGGQLQKRESTENRFERERKEAAATLENLLSSLGVEYLGMVHYFGEEHEQTAHGFRILSNGGEFYQLFGKHLAMGENREETREWLKDHAEELKELATHYKEEN